MNVLHRSLFAFALLAGLMATLSLPANADEAPAPPADATQYVMTVDGMS